MKQLITILCFIFLAVPPVQARMVSIKGVNVNMRSGPGKNFEVVWELGHGYPLEVIESKGQWVRVRDADNDTGWVKQRLLANVAHVVVKKPMINIRSGPSRKHRVLGQAKDGVVFKTMGKRKGWIKVRHENGLVGWVARELVWGW